MKTGNEQPYPGKMTRDEFDKADNNFDNYDFWSEWASEFPAPTQRGKRSNQTNMNRHPRTWDEAVEWLSKGELDFAKSLGGEMNNIIIHRGAKLSEYIHKPKPDLVRVPRIVYLPEVTIPRDASIHNCYGSESRCLTDFPNEKAIKFCEVLPAAELTDEECRELIEASRKEVGYTQKPLDSQSFNMTRAVARMLQQRAPVPVAAVELTDDRVEQLAKECFNHLLPDLSWEKDFVNKDDWRKGVRFFASAFLKQPVKVERKPWRDLELTRICDKVAGECNNVPASNWKQAFAAGIISEWNQTK